VALGHCADNGQAESGAYAVTLGGEEALKQTGLVGGTDSGSVIFDLDAESCLLGSDAHGNWLASIVTERIFHQVYDGGAQMFTAYHNARRRTL
jgi:hypothetical protein